jgi:hypothetical protein
MSGKQILARLILVAVAGAVTPLSAQGPRDVQGWAKLTWGMSNDQALAAYAGQIKQNPRGSRHGITDRFTIMSLIADDLELEAAVATPDDSDQVIRVILTPAHEPHDPRYVHDRRYYYDRLLIFLVEKYGSPTFTDVSGEEKLHLWAFPSTTITLFLRGDTLAVGYLAVNASAHDVL